MRLRPTTRPPYMIPQYCSVLKGTGPKFVRQYVGFLVYVWTFYGNAFWLYISGIQNNTLYGYVWKNTYYQYSYFNISMIDCLY